MKDIFNRLNAFLYENIAWGLFCSLRTALFAAGGSICVSGWGNSSLWICGNSSWTAQPATTESSQAEAPAVLRHTGKDQFPKLTFLGLLQQLQKHQLQPLKSWGSCNLSRYRKRVTQLKLNEEAKTTKRWFVPNRSTNSEKVETSSKPASSGYTSIQQAPARAAAGTAQKAAAKRKSGTSA